MATGNGTILELRLEAEGLSGQITCPPKLRPAPGQYLVAAGPDPGEALPTVLFPGGFDLPAQGKSTPAALYVAPPLPPSWSVGMPLVLRGPLGSGFHMPPSARRVALACLDGEPFRLLPLVDQALRQRAAVAIYAAAAHRGADTLHSADTLRGADTHRGAGAHHGASTPAGLPEDVEVLPIDLLPEAPAWADFLAIDANRARLPELRTRLGLAPFQQLSCQAQVLVRTPMPCAGLAECGICAVSTRKGWALSCIDGPVFNFHQLEGS